MSLDVCVTKKTPTPLRADQPYGLRDGGEEVLRVVEQQVRLVAEEDHLRLVDITDLGQLLEEVAPR
jgi:hypothetical protein